MRAGRMARMQRSACNQRLQLPISVASHPVNGAAHIRKFRTMTKRSTLSAIGDMLDIFGSAISASRALEGNRKPYDRDLRKLGIDPAHFDRIARF
jgi:hypothetical protein